MDESMTIKQRAYDKFDSDIIGTLRPLMKNPEAELVMTRSGVIIDDKYEMIMLNCQNTSYVAFKVERDSFKVISVTINPNTFNNYFGIFELKDKAQITEFLKSFEGLCLDLYPQKGE